MKNKIDKYSAIPPRTKLKGNEIHKYNHSFPLLAKESHGRLSMMIMQDHPLEKKFPHSSPLLHKERGRGEVVGLGQL